MANKQNNYSRTGWGFIILSVICVVIFLVDYKTKFVFHLTSISELGTILGGTSGIFASLAGLFFVLENLELQRQTIFQQQQSILQQQTSIDLQREELKNQILEMKESNDYFKQQTETLKTQSIESTFFKLLENHRSLVISLKFKDDIGYSGLASFYNNLKSSTTTYYQTAFTGNIKNISDADIYPLKLLYYQIENVEQLYDNILHLIKLIKFKLNDSLFYHETFFNSLSKAEKYILGMYVLNEKSESLNHFQSKIFDYLQYYQGSGNACYIKDIVPYFPNFTISSPRPWGKFIIGDPSESGGFDKGLGEFSIEVAENYLQKKIILLAIRLEYDWKGKDYSISNDYYSELNQVRSCKLNLFETLKEHIFKKFSDNFTSSKNGFPFSMYFSLVFVIDYESKVYHYWKRYNLNTFNYHEIGADMSIENK